MEKEVKRILSFGKKILKKEIYKRIKKVKDEKELNALAKYSILNFFERELYEIEKEIDRMENEERDSFFIENGAILIPGKIKLFQAEFKEEDFYKLLELINKTKEEIKNAQSIEIV